MFGCTAGDRRPGRQFLALKTALADFGKRALRIQDQLPSDLLCGFESSGIDILKQHIVDEADERRNTRDLLLAARLKKNAHAAFVDRARPLHQKAGLLQSSDLGRHVGRGKRDVICQTANRDAAGALRLGHPHQYDELARREVQLLAEGIATREQAPNALHHRIDTAAKIRIGPLNQEFLPGDGHGSPVGVGFRHSAS
jgi:hypothetical protein